ncbi:hypothetical protein VNO80_09505 [Phaseolus coccineus]|uniref:AB hydrolase-1 domain-containing protein n=1 Tax=Phaseolus coccineus TaxID=3886 RepID=A0AAN9NCP4_PHACN
MGENERKQKHFVLVHGLGHGGWCWYKLKPVLESAGHKVTVLDLAASGIKPDQIEDIHTFSHYSKPLLDLLASLAPTETIVLVGHSFGGMTIALAIDKFPEKISFAVFLAAFVPDTHHRPSYVLEQFHDGWTARSRKLEAKRRRFLVPSFCPRRCINSAPLRKGSLFLEELSEAQNFPKEGYGSASCAYIVCSGDLAIPKEYQQWMIQNAGIDIVREINGADHMAMLSKTQDLCSTLLEITDN